MKKENGGSSGGSPREKFSFANGANAEYIDELYQSYKDNPTNVEPSWQQFFTGYELALTNFRKPASGATEAGANHAAKVEAFINAYRRLGHLAAHINPLMESPPDREFLKPEAHGLSDISDQEQFLPANLPEKKEMSFPDIYNFLQETYCRKIGAEFRNINNIDIVSWLQKKMESCRNKPVYEKPFRMHILKKLGEAEGFEKFLQARYLGQKRFSIEGLESLIPMLDILCNDGKKSGLEEINIGMAHRGRLNVLTNILGKSKEKMLQEFEDSEVSQFDIDGDVKYHMGFANDVETYENGKIRVYLSPNPSHLEMVNPVVQGFTHCRQRLIKDEDRKKILPVLLHGDAAFIGQGITAETLNLSRLSAYTTGGTIHIITNNQLGFTTEPSDSRSTAYSSAIAKIISAPILHVNADDPEACVWTMQIALEYRQKFGRDIVIDLVGYRRHGHNETDEPAFTQPKMYKTIQNHPTVYTLYGDILSQEGVVDKNGLKSLTKSIRTALQGAQDKIRDKSNPYVEVHTIPKEIQQSIYYVKVDRNDINKEIKTNITKKTLENIGQSITAIPSGFTPHPKISRLLEQRREMIQGKGSVDWAFAELLAFGSLADEGHHIRLSGQDCQRGTFSSRHGVLTDFETGDKHQLLNQINDQQATVSIINSPLSELGVLGFEFGYAVADSNSLVLWEAQFGDFANGAQIIVDQFLVASEAKWKQMCGLVMLLPHGHEGMGPEHSSARPERFLQLCGNLNIQVAIPTTPAQHFHILRRQMRRKFRKPLILMTPKSLLRRPEVISIVEDFTKGQFNEILPDSRKIDSDKVKNVVLCTGKIYYEIMETIANNSVDSNIPVIRVEQLYPFPKAKLTDLLSQYKNLKNIHWTQEEPQNMGAWNFVRPRIENLNLNKSKLFYFGRKNSGTTAEGSSSAHKQEQKRIIYNSLGLSCGVGGKGDHED